MTIHDNRRRAEFWLASPRRFLACLLGFCPVTMFPCPGEAAAIWRGGPAAVIQLTWEVAMLLDQNKFVVKSQNKTFSSKKSYEIVDAENGKVLGTAKDTTGFLASLLGSTTIEVRDASNDTPVFTVGRSGFLMKKDQVTDPQGQVVGRYKPKMFSLGGGFNVYDKEGKQIAEIQGKMFKAEYKFVSPDKSEMGSVSRTWGGMAKSLLSGTDSYGVQIDPKFANDSTAKMLILGATIAVESIFKKKAGKAAGGGGGGGGEE